MFSYSPFSAIYKEVLNNSIQELSNHEKYKFDINFSSFSITYVNENGGTSMCRTDTLNTSEFP